MKSTLKAALILIVLLSVGVASAQTEAQCGSVFESEFGQGDEAHLYRITLNPGDVLRVTGDVVGAYMSVWIAINAPDGDYVAGTGYFNCQACSPRATPRIQTDVLSQRGVYSVRVGPGNIGLYTVGFGCTLRDGTTINPGDTRLVPTAESSNTSSTISSGLQFSGVGFPGLAPVDFSNVARFPLILATPMTGAVTPTGGEILGFQLDGTSGSIVNLSFSRLTGNLNLGLVVLSADNKVVFQASLVTSQTLSTQFSLPADGQYTIGVFRIDLMPPTSPESTAFTIRVDVS